jgi:hypothetical protein
VTNNDGTSADAELSLLVSAHSTQCVLEKQITHDQLGSPSSVGFYQLLVNPMAGNISSLEPASARDEDSQDNPE